MKLLSLDYLQFGVRSIGFQSPDTVSVSFVCVCVCVCVCACVWVGGGRGWLGFGSRRGFGVVFRGNLWGTDVVVKKMRQEAMSQELDAWSLGCRVRV